MKSKVGNMAKRVKVDDEVMTEDEYNRALDKCEWSGRVDALADATRKANAKAGEHYSARQDEQARIWREVANWLAGLEVTARKIHQNLVNGVEDDEEK